MKREIYVVGHRNPDTDSICSPIAYAYLKNQVENTDRYIPVRIGAINGETRFVLDHLKVEAPQFVNTVKTQVRDIELEETTPVSPEISIKEAWEIMKSSGEKTLAVSSDGKKLDGIISIGTIAQSYMDAYDSSILARASTPYGNVVKVLEGDMVVGDTERLISDGLSHISAMNPDVMENFINPGDMIILGNRYESQLCAIEMGAQCIIVSGGMPVASSIKRMAKSKGCSIIVSPLDTFAVSRVICQSIPIRYFMRKEDLTVFSMDDFVDSVKEIMIKKRHRNFPVVDKDNNFVAMLSRNSLLDLKRKQVILLDHNERSQSIDGLEDADILEIIDHHRIGSIETTGPVFFRNQPLGSTSTIVANMYKEFGVETPLKIAGLLCSAILSDTLMLKSPTCTPEDVRVAQELAKIASIDISEYSKAIFRVSSNLKNKNDAEVFNNDLKEFSTGDLHFAVGQITSMDKEELDALKDRLIQHMKKIHPTSGKDMILFMLTDIVNENTELLFVGDSNGIIPRVFPGKIQENSIFLPGVVSRKKQIIPPLLRYF